MASNFNFNGTGANRYLIEEYDTYVNVTDTVTGIVSPIGKGVCRIQYDELATPNQTRPTRQGADMGPVNLPPLIYVSDILDSTGASLPFSTLAEYAQSLALILNTAGGGGGGGTTVDNLYLDTPTVASATTDVTGTAFVSLGSAACRVVTIVNNATGAVDLEIAFGSASSGIKLKAQAIAVFPVTANANSIKLRRFDQGTAPATVTYFYNSPIA